VSSTSQHNTGITRRGIQIALGGLWFLDGLLQLQPQMFTSQFASQVIVPAAQGQPGWVSGPMHLFMSVFLLQPALANTGIAVVQIGLGILILLKKTAKLGLIASVGWGLFIWYIGEGFSGLASGHAMLLMGLPGAALIYVLLAIGTLVPASKPSDKRPAYWLIIVWICIWTVGSIYQVLPGQNTVADNTAMLSANAGSTPHWLTSVDTSVANYIGRFGTTTTPPASSMAGMPGMSGMYAPAPVSSGPTKPRAVSGFGFILLLALLQIAIAFAVIVPGFLRWFGVIGGSILSLCFWVVGQSLGSYYSGVATDPNTGPLLILLGIAVLGCTQREPAVRQFFARIKNGFLSEMRAFNEG
jgi:hypothetical protein